MQSPGNKSQARVNKAHSAAVASSAADASDLMPPAANNSSSSVSQSTVYSNLKQQQQAMQSDDDDLRSSLGGAGASAVDSILMREQDRLLPIANVARIMKQAVPNNAKIAKDAKETVQECVSEFIAFVTSEAAERVHGEKRKTITGEDLVWAMEQLGFDQYGHLMKVYLHRYREATKTEGIGAATAQSLVNFDDFTTGTVPNADSSAKDDSKTFIPHH